MPSLYYPKPMRYVDRARDTEYIGPGTFDVPTDAVDEYLADGWDRVDDAGGTIDTASAESAADGATAAAESETTEDTDASADDSDAASTDASDDEVCGAELSAGGTCDRLASECPYHGD